MRNRLATMAKAQAFVACAQVPAPTKGENQDWIIPALDRIPDKAKADHIWEAMEDLDAALNLLPHIFSLVLMSQLSARYLALTKKFEAGMDGFEAMDKEEK